MSFQYINCLANAFRKRQTHQSRILYDRKTFICNKSNAYRISQIFCPHQCIQTGSNENIQQCHAFSAQTFPSAIRAKNDWNRFKKLIQEKEEENSPSGGKKITLTEELRVILPELSRGCTGTAVKMLQVFLQVQTDGIFGIETENALRTFQKNTNQLADGICGRNSWMAIAVHMRENTYAGY